MPKLRRAAMLAVAPLSCAVLLSACGTKTIDRQSELSLARDAVSAIHGGAAKSIDCPSGVAATAGTTFNCHVQLKGGKKVDFKIKVDQVKGSRGHLTVVGYQLPS